MHGRNDSEQVFDCIIYLINGLYLLIFVCVRESAVVVQVKFTKLNVCCVIVF